MKYKEVLFNVLLDGTQFTMTLISKDQPCSYLHAETPLLLV